MILTRQQFADHFDALVKNLHCTNPNSLLWIPEEGQIENKATHFVATKNIEINPHKDRFYLWCQTTLTGRVRCYSSDTKNNLDWWGFTCQDDIPTFLIMWG